MPVSEPSSDKLAVNDRVSWRGHVGTIDTISPEGIHYRVVFDEPHPPISYLVNGSCWFYSHELERSAS